MISDAVKIKIMPLDRAHLDFWYLLHNDPENMRHQPIIQTSREQLELQLRNLREYDLGDHDQTSYKWAVIEIDSDQPAGIVSFYRMQEDHAIGRIGYTFLPKFWNRGIASAAVKLAVEQIFTRGGIERLEAVCSIHNQASRRVLEKAGFGYEGIRRGYLRIRGERVDHFSFGLLKSDWLKNKH
ncbi:MAG: GNAT family N-acetyltransferase [Candidatus Neomarinimicrobiota bacterium]